jgi:hypothetical protein
VWKPFPEHFTQFPTFLEKYNDEIRHLTELKPLPSLTKAQAIVLAPLSISSVSFVSDFFSVRLCDGVETRNPLTFEPSCLIIENLLEKFRSRKQFTLYRPPVKRIACQAGTATSEHTLFQAVRQAAAEYLFASPISAAWPIVF